MGITSIWNPKQSTPIKMSKYMLIFAILLATTALIQAFPQPQATSDAQMDVEERLKSMENAIRSIQDVIRGNSEKILNNTKEIINNVKSQTRLANLIADVLNKLG